MTTTVPKEKLINKILEIVPAPEIRQFFHIARTTDLETRLSSFRKAELEALLRSTTDWNRRLEQLEESYPLGAAGTFYIPKVEPHSYSTEWVTLVNDLSFTNRDHALFSNTSSVRAVYIDKPPEVYSPPELLEIPLVYERKLEYRVGDPPDADDYGDLYDTYSLERAYIWLMDEYSHGVICCTGLAAVRAILEFGRLQLRLNWTLTNMTEEMFDRLRDYGQPRVATYPSLLPNAPTITVSDPLLTNTEEYRQLEADPSRLQSSGFFRNDAGDFLPSFGIARRYARIWTPWRRSKALLAISMRGILSRTEEELGTEYETNIEGYVSYFLNAPVTVGDKHLTGKYRSVFQELMKAIVVASTRENREIEIEEPLLSNLVEYKTRLGFQVISKFECENCGGGLGRCPDCLLPYVASYKDGKLELTCPKCKRSINVDEGYLCECGTNNEIVGIPQHLQLLPGVELLAAVEEFIKLMDDVAWRGVFLIDGMILRLFERLPGLPDTYPSRIALDDLRYWRTVAHHHRMAVNQTFLSVLGHTKEKCKRGGSPPTIERCQNCLESTISAEQIQTKDEMCLPRIMGLAINHNFDGIHHGHEIADVRYEDFLDDSDVPVSIGIHLKSRNRPKTQGQGRSTTPIKALYTQVFFSAYESLQREDVEFDVIGISIPNNIKRDVVDSFEILLNRLGFIFLVVDETDWLKIVNSVNEQLAFEQNQPTDLIPN